MSYSRSGVAAATQQQAGLVGGAILQPQHALDVHMVTQAGRSAPANIAPVPNAPALDEVVDRLDRLIDVYRGNLDRLCAAGNRSFGPVPDQDGSGQDKVQGAGIVDRIATQLSALARLGTAYNEAIARIERLV